MEVVEVGSVEVVEVGSVEVVEAGSVDVGSVDDAGSVEAGSVEVVLWSNQSIRTFRGGLKGYAILGCRVESASCRAECRSALTFSHRRVLLPPDYTTNPQLRGRSGLAQRPRNPCLG